MLFNKIDIDNREWVEKNLSWNISFEELNKYYFKVINFVYGKFFENIELNNISSDGIDIDFGKFKFQNIKCSQINNDCLDIAGSIVNGNGIYAENILDKGLSIGEASIAEIENIYLYKNKLGIAVKDGSKVKINNYIFDSNTYDMAVYTKKKEYRNSSLYIDGIKDFDDKKIFVGKSNKLTINGNNYKI